MSGESIWVVAMVPGIGSRSAGRRARVVLLAEERLVGDAVRSALSSRSLDVITIEWPASGRLPPTLRRTVASLRPSAGLVVGDLQDSRRRTYVRMLVAAMPLPWALVVSHDDTVAWGDLVAAGVTLLPMSISLADLALSLTRLMAGEELMSRPERERIVLEWRARRTELDELADRLHRLSPRESEVLGLLAAGLSVKDIAAQGEVAETTVRTQVKAVLRKLEVGSQLAAVALVRQLRPRANRT